MSRLAIKQCPGANQTKSNKSKLRGVWHYSIVELVCKNGGGEAGGFGLDGLLSRIVL